MGDARLIVADTHVLVWLLEDHPRLGPEARVVIDSSVDTGILICPISLVEIARLVAHDRLALSIGLREWMMRALGAPGVALAPIDAEIAVDSVQLPGDLHRDPADRLIVATARTRLCPLLTADRRLLEYGARGYVRAIDAAN